MDQEELKILARADKRARDRREATHAALVAAIWEVADAGMPQVDIVRTVGLTRERVRQLCDPEYRKRAATRLQLPEG